MSALLHEPYRVTSFEAPPTERLSSQNAGAPKSNSTECGCVISTANPHKCISNISAPRTQEDRVFSVMVQRPFKARYTPGVRQQCIRMSSGYPVIVHTRQGKPHMKKLTFWDIFWLDSDSHGFHENSLVYTHGTG